MKVSTILDHIDSGHMALPEFQRGYVWNRDQVRGLMDSLYRRHPVGSLLVWATESKTAEARNDPDLPPGIVKLLLDGQQRITSLYGIIRGKAPEFFDGNEQTFTGLYFNLESEEFSFYSPIKMKDDPLWVDVSKLMIGGNDGLGERIAALSIDPEKVPNVGAFLGRLNQVLGIRDVDFHIDEVTGEDKTVDIVVDIFNQVNSGGTKLSKGDLALAKICADWPDARSQMKTLVARWHDAGYNFNLDWLLRNVNTITTGEAKFEHLHGVEASDVQEGLRRAERSIDFLLNLIADRFGLDHDRVLFGRYAFPVMTHYVDRRGGHLKSKEEIDKLLYWYLHASMWGRFSGSTESYIDQDLKLLEGLDAGLERLIKQLRLAHGGLRVDPGHFGGWSLGARFYPVLYLLTRTQGARDWWYGGMEIRQHFLGKMNSPELHHIFPKARLYEAGYSRPEVNAVANFCLLTKDTNLWISDRDPSEYLPEIEAAYPGALASQWIPIDPELWQIPRYLDFLEERKKLLAEAANEFLDGLFKRDEVEVEPAPPVVETPATSLPEAPPGAIESEEEEEILAEMNSWVVSQGLPEGTVAFELAHPDTGVPMAILDLAWENGLQEGFSQPVALLLNEGPDTLAIANEHGFRYFTDANSFRTYVRHEVLAEHDDLEATG